MERFHLSLGQPEPKLLLPASALELSIALNKWSMTLCNVHTRYSTMSRVMHGDPKAVPFSSNNLLILSGDQENEHCAKSYTLTGYGMTLPFQI